MTPVGQPDLTIVLAGMQRFHVDLADAKTLGDIVDRIEATANDRVSIDIEERQARLKFSA